MKVSKAGITKHMQAVTLDRLPEGLQLTVRLDYAHFHFSVEETRRQPHSPVPADAHPGTHHIPEPVDIELEFTHDGANWDDDITSLRCFVGLTADSDEEAQWLQEPVVYVAKEGMCAHILFLDASQFKDVQASRVEELQDLALRGDRGAFATLSVKHSPSFLWLEATARTPEDWVLPASGQDRPFGLQNALTVKYSDRTEAAAGVGIPAELAQAYSPVHFRPLNRRFRRDAHAQVVQRTTCRKNAVSLNFTEFPTPAPPVRTWRYVREVL